MSPQLSAPRDANNVPSKDWGNLEYSHIIRLEKHFEVVIDKSNMLDWETSPAYDEDEKQRPDIDRRNKEAFLADVAVAEATPRPEYDSDVNLHFKRMLGEAIVNCLKYDLTTARKLLDSANRYLQLRNEEASRRWYLESSTEMAAALTVIGILVWAFRGFDASVLGRQGFWLVIGCSAGAIGALLSVIARSGRLHFDASAGRSLHELEARSRIIAGAISGLIVSLAVRSDLIFGYFTASGHQDLVMVLASVAAGSGERLASSIISKFHEAHSPSVSDMDGSVNTREDKS